MKFLVDELPYYGEECYFERKIGCSFSSSEDCPRNWSKYIVCSDDNPHECKFLKEEKPEQDK